MKKIDYSRTIYALCLDNTSQCSYLDKLEKAYRRTIPKIEVEDLLVASPLHPHKILLIDYRHCQEIMTKIIRLPIASNRFETIIFNVDKRLETEEIITMGNLKGLYYRDDNTKDIAEDFKQIVNGKNCLPHYVMCQLLHYYRHIVSHFPTSISVELTSREVQILKSLQTGASNSKIAEAHYISEFTVKSHLYQIFKKLAVKNRVQAIAWANRNLVSQ
ncbi:LuxR C-terminal-related transcriptional regulator [Vibrio sp. S4M6]|uniref:LuxR C-terminal-related transcriptional regulator n=1 Tax=Vibrio sinus TaxID=2946865 RepID=UPI00202A60F8|nr:LuxR C-terminal-related transcriptional regulator [Vibrio sinus]MCL9780518.1 LuxR C-terminal-related transcriptional regulator [Vibrio sinus]